MRVVVVHPCTKFEACRPCHSEECVSALMGQVTLTFDLLTLKLVHGSHQRWGTFVPNLSMLGLRVLKLFAMYATDGWTDRQTKQTLLPPSYGRGHKNRNACKAHTKNAENATHARIESVVCVHCVFRVFDCVASRAYVALCVLRTTAWKPHEGL